MAKERTTEEETNGQVIRLTIASVVAFLILLGAYVLLVYIMRELEVMTGSSTAWVALLIVLALATAAGLGYSYQVLKLLKAKSLLPRLRAARADSVMTRGDDAPQATPETDMATVHSTRGQWLEDVLPVVDSTGRLNGIVTDADLSSSGEAGTVEEIMSPAPTVAYADNTLADVWEIMQASGHSKIPIVDRDTKKYRGVVSARRILEHMVGPGASYHAPPIHRHPARLRTAA